MSQRSILEINHDFSHEIKAQPERFLQLLGTALGSGSDDCWDRLRGFGITRVVQVHHSTDRKVVISGSGWSTDYPIP